MFEQLMDLVKQQSQKTVVENPDIPNEQNEAVMQSAGSSIMDSLKGMIGNGGNITDLFHQKSEADIANHPVTQNASSNFISTLMNKFGMDSNKAGGIANSLLPSIMSKFVNKTNDPNDNSFNIQSILGSLTGGGAGNILDRNHDGQVNLGDVKSLFGS